ncbi:MAG TPA: chloride channel protein [Synergistaceae bacterium]|nr:chloride channel protein [Synergistaceae bacterium]HPQ36331.1 chloride channel protein [Synergistaceae bacterium]
MSQRFLSPEDWGNPFLSKERIFFRGMVEILHLALLGILVGGVVSLFVSLIGLGEARVGVFPRSRLFLLPGALLLCALLEVRFFPGVAGHGMESLRRIYSEGENFPPCAWLVKGFRTLVTLVSGGSGGIVGPSAYVGSALAAVSSQEREPLGEKLFYGAAAGVAVILGTPLGATLFAMESLEKPLCYSFSPERFFRGLWCSFWAWKYAFFWLPWAPHPHLAPFSAIPEGTPLFFLLCGGGGLFFGGIAICHVLLLRSARRGMRLIWKNPFLRACAGALLILLIDFFSGGTICGTGQEHLSLYFHGQGEDVLLQGFWKSLATGITVGAGGSAGMVGPTFFVGAMGGSFFAHLFALPSDLFALLGAAAVLGGAANTPVAAVVFLVEICGIAILPSGIILCGISYLVGRRWHLFEREDFRESP